MYRLFAFAVLILNIFFVVLFAPKTFATSPDLVIYQVQAGGVAVDNNDKLASTREFVSVYNNSDQDIVINNWCLTNKTSQSFACFDSTSPAIELRLPSHSFATVGSDNFASLNNYNSDINFITTNKTSGSIIASSDTISLIDPNGQAADSVGWISTLSGGYVLQRQFSQSRMDILIDTDANGDFQKLNNLVIPVSGVYEEQTPDVCLNIDGIQSSIPEGYVYNGINNCAPEVFDACLNLGDIQTDLPEGYKFNQIGECVMNLLPIKINELLPNVSGVDDEKEFIEFYNPNNVEISLKDYMIIVGTDGLHQYYFTDDLKIGAGEYLAIYNKEIDFTLLNSSSLIQLKSKDGMLIDQSEIYSNPNEDESWALIDNVWQYTNQITPNAANLVSISDDFAVVNAVSNLQPCAANQYRSPETNRCRLLVSVASALAPCKDGQYRSEETNRCRNIVTDISSLIQCAEGQERNPATNRCRSAGKILGASDLAPCKEGQERNSETNRCRNIINMPQADYATESTKSVSRNDYAWWSFAGVSALALGYGVWEWRFELIKLFRSMKIKIHLKK